MRLTSRPIRTPDGTRPTGSWIAKHLIFHHAQLERLRAAALVKALAQNSDRRPASAQEKTLTDDEVRKLMNRARRTTKETANMRNECLDAALDELSAAGIRDIAHARGGQHYQVRWAAQRRGARLQPAMHTIRQPRRGERQSGRPAHAARGRLPRRPRAGEAAAARSYEPIGAARCGCGIGACDDAQRSRKSKSPRRKRSEHSWVS